MTYDSFDSFVSVFGGILSPVPLLESTRQCSLSFTLMVRFTMETQQFARSQKACAHTTKAKHNIYMKTLKFHIRLWLKDSKSTFCSFSFSVIQSVSAYVCVYDSIRQNWSDCIFMSIQQRKKMNAKQRLLNHILSGIEFAIRFYCKSRIFSIPWCDSSWVWSQTRKINSFFFVRMTKKK